VLAGYGIFAWLAAGLGYFLVNSYPAAGIEHLILSAVLLSVSVVPVVLTRVAAPDTAQAQPLSLGELYFLSPLGVVGACGLAFSGCWSTNFAPSGTTLMFCASSRCRVTFPT